MIDERHEELASLYALGLLEGAERAAFEAQCANDAALRTLVRELRDSASLLAFTAPAASPSPDLKARLLAQLDDSDSVADTSNTVPFNFTTWLALAAAACFLVATVYLTQSLLTTREELSSVRTEMAFADIARRAAEQQMKAERIVLNAQLKAQADLSQFKIAALTSMLGNSPDALAVAVWNPAKQEGVFTVAKLPAASAAEDYELWVIDPQQPKPISGGVFTVGADGQARVQFKTEAPVAAIAKFAVSREKKGGAPKLGGPQGTVIMISQ